MIKVFAVFFAVGCVAAYRGHLALRAYNRRMWPSMQRGPIYLWNLLVFALLGAVAAAMAHVLELHH